MFRITLADDAYTGTRLGRCPTERLIETVGGSQSLLSQLLVTNPGSFISDPNGSLFAILVQEPCLLFPTIGNDVVEEGP
jgi:hypothetical protein